jgi:hypothetical protein
MKNFNVEILSCIKKLRERYRNSRTCVILNYPVIEIVKFMRDQEISTKLSYDSDGFEFHAPDQRYYSKISHYDFRMAERRWTRNKHYIFSIIKDLKYCGLWPYISNKDFLMVNSHNENTDPKKLKILLKKIVSNELSQ